MVERKELYEHKGTGVRFTEEEYQMLVEAAKEPNPEYDDDVWESAMEKLHGEPAPDWLRSEREKHEGLEDVFFYSATEPLRGAYTAEEILREGKYAPCYEMLDGQGGGVFGTVSTISLGEEGKNNIEEEDAVDGDFKGFYIDTKTGDIDNLLDEDDILDEAESLLYEEDGIFHDDEDAPEGLAALVNAYRGLRSDEDDEDDDEMYGEDVSVGDIAVHLGYRDAEEYIGEREMDGTLAVFPDGGRVFDDLPSGTDCASTWIHTEGGGVGRNPTNASGIVVNQREWILGQEYVPAEAYLADMVKIAC